MSLDSIISPKLPEIYHHVMHVLLPCYLFIYYYYNHQGYHYSYMVNLFSFGRKSLHNIYIYIYISCVLFFQLIQRSMDSVIYKISVFSTLMNCMKSHKFMNKLKWCYTYIHIYIYLEMYKEVYMHVHGTHHLVRNDVLFPKIQKTTKRKGKN